MTERTMIFLIIASMIVAVTLIGGIVASIRYVAETKACKYTAESLDLLREMNMIPKEVIGEEL